MTVLADHNLEGQAILLVEIMLDIEIYVGVGRIFIPLPATEYNKPLHM